VYISEHHTLSLVSERRQKEMLRTIWSILRWVLVGMLIIGIGVWLWFAGGANAQPEEVIVRETVVVTEVHKIPLFVYENGVIADEEETEVILSKMTTPTPVVITVKSPITTASTITVTGMWEEVDFHPAGDRQDIVNVDHDGDNRVTVSWFYAGPADEGTPEVACTAHITTSPSGERITMKGAFRTWQWTGSAPPTKTEIQAHVKSWIDVLEKEPRGMCAKEGAYQVSWQEPNLAP